MASKQAESKVDVDGWDPHGPYLTAIRDAPDEDAPRLAYADWLVGRQDEARAEFLRLLVGLRRPATSQEGLLKRIPIRARMRELRGVIDVEWSAAVGDPGLIGEILVSQSTLTGRDVHFWVVTRLTPKTVFIRGIESVVVGGRFGPGGDWQVMPVVPTDEEIRRIPEPGLEFRTKMFASPDGGVHFYGGRTYNKFWNGSQERCYHNH
jgi:uncharacterized protein (TIGR02996 family)